VNDPGFCQILSRGLVCMVEQKWGIEVKCKCLTCHVIFCMCSSIWSRRGDGNTLTSASAASMWSYSGRGGRGGSQRWHRGPPATEAGQKQHDATLLSSVHSHQHSFCNLRQLRSRRLHTGWTYRSTYHMTRFIDAQNTFKTVMTITQNASREQNYRRA